MYDAYFKNTFCIILSKNGKFIDYKINECQKLKINYIIISGKKIEKPKIVYIPPKGKYDAINSSTKYIPKNTEIIILNDDDTFRISHILPLLIHIVKKGYADLVFPRLEIIDSPQKIFTKFLDFIRKHFLLITANGELMVMTKKVFDEILPIPPCKAEDTYIIFKALEKGYKVRYIWEKSIITIRKTKTPEQEINYKKRTVTGIYQALSYSTPPLSIRIFYYLLPFIIPLFIPLGKYFRAWAKGILLGYINYLLGDKSGNF